MDTTKAVHANTVTNLPAYTNDNGIGNNPPDASFEAANSQKLYKLNGNSNKTGLGISLKVMAGDRIDIFGKSVIITLLASSLLWQFESFTLIIARWLLISLASWFLPMTICAFSSQSKTPTSFWAESSALCPFTVTRQEIGALSFLIRFFCNPKENGESVFCFHCGDHLTLVEKKIPWPLVIPLKYGPKRC